METKMQHEHYCYAAKVHPGDLNEAGLQWIERYIGRPSGEIDRLFLGLIAELRESRAAVVRLESSLEHRCQACWETEAQAGWDE